MYNRYKCLNRAIKYYIWHNRDVTVCSDISSVHSMMEGRSRAGSEVSRGSRVGGAYRHASVERGPDLQDMGPAENVVATLRLLVALEHYLGSLGPKIVDLLTEALRMEKVCLLYGQML